jgi:hypothetical protein
MPRQYIRHSPADRFWKHVNVIPDESSCWPFQGQKTKKGYGLFILDMGPPRKHIVAHRMAYILIHGPIPDDINVCHKCDNPPCCRDDHFFLGTNADNTHDMIAKGRAYHPAGSKHQNSKLSEDAVREIRESWPAVSHKELAKRYGVSRGAIRNIVKRRGWTHV